MKNWLYVWFSVLFCCGCSTILDEPRPDDPAFSPVYADDNPMQVAADGSIFSRGLQGSLYSDTKARSVGDVITVMLAESTSASKSESASQEKDTTLALDAMTILGETLTRNGANMTNQVTQSNSFEGDASGSQSNNLQGEISVTVVKVMGNGILMIRGEKWLTLGNGSEFIRVTGLIRPEDIQPDNTITSTRIANARIYYGGTGDFSNTQKQGWIGKFFNGPWWFF